MRKYLQIVLFVFVCNLLCTFPCFAQPHWNEWINFSQQYYKIPITKNGIYRLDSLILIKAGIPLSSIDPRHLQLFFRGQEQYIFIQGESDGVFNATDYMEFYGKQNDGSPDSILYKGELYNQPIHQPNPYYSLFNDTSAYFLTWNNLSTNKRIQLAPDTAFASAPIPTNYFLQEDIVDNHTNYYYGATTSSDITFPGYDETEGWSGTDFYQGTSNITTFNTSNIYPAGPNVTVKLAVMGASNDPSSSPDHILKIGYKNKSGTVVSLDNLTFDGYKLAEPNYSFSASMLGTSTDIIVSAQNGNFSTSRNTVPYVVMKYPHNLDLSNRDYYELFVPDNPSQSKSNFSFTNINDKGASMYVYDLENHLKIPMIKTGSTYKALIPNTVSSVEKFCIVKSENQYLNIPSIKAVNGTGYFTNYAALSTDSAYLIITHKSLTSGALAYKNYRASIAGGSHNVIMADMDELYNQFGYGIPKYPFTIRHFVKYCLDTFPSPPQNLFLLGKSIQTNEIRNTNVDPSGKNYAQSLVPTIAYPPCDNLLVNAMNGKLLAPAVPIGRLAARNNTDILNYLNKVKEYEHPSPNPDEWMKHFIFMGGGSNASQQAQLCGYLAKYEKTIEDTSFGGYVHKFCKNSSSNTQISYTDSIRNLVNNGVSIITFFGHTSSSLFEFNLLPPDQYNNKDGRYPFFIADGCTAGDIHQPFDNGYSSSEIFTLAKQGVIGFLASPGPGTAYEMDLYTNHLFNEFGKYLYGKSIGKCIQAAVDSTEGNVTNAYLNATCLEMSLHGDPAIVIHSNKLPDYAIKNSSVYFNPSYVSTDLDSFKVNVIITNIGKATRDSVRVNIKRSFPDNTYSYYSQTFPKLYYKDTIHFTLPVDPIHGAGLNRFEVQVDSANIVPELDDVTNNNILAPNEVPLLIYSGDIIPVYPYKYAIVPKDSITLKAYTANPFSASARYIFEIDTTDRFNSPLKKTQYVTQRGAVVKALFNLWSTSPLLLKDSTVYFWHVRRDTSDLLHFHWRESSFQYIANKKGWGQSHYFQFLKGNRFQYIDTNRLSRYFDFDNTIDVINVKTLNAEVWGISHFADVYFELNSLERYLYSWISSAVPHLIISIINPVTGRLWYNDGSGKYGDLPGHPSEVGAEGFEFYTSTPVQQENLRRFLQDTIPCGSKVILFTSGNHNLGDLLGKNSTSANPGLVKAFQSIGGTQFPNLRNNAPYILVGRKCGAASEQIGVNDSSVVFVYDTMRLKRGSGLIYSDIAGPASKWKSMHWKYISPEAISNPAMAAKDSMIITIMGINSSGGTDTLIKNISKDSLDIYNLDQIINAKTYPYLKLQAKVTDTLLHTPAQLKYWRLYYDGVPDAALNPAKHFSFYNPTVQQGDSIKMSVGIENISDYKMDSLTVDFRLYDANRNRIPLQSIKMDSLQVDSMVVPSISFSTLNLPAGLNSLWIEANPYGNTYQPEQYHFNNIGALPFIVNADKINPLLDVTFDGIHIMNNDIVSAKPYIVVRLKDENTFLALNDTSDFEVYLKYPSQSTYSRIYFGKNMSFTSAVLPDNSCSINYTPALADGKYELRVQAKDRSGNASGKTEYNISFEIINKPAITNVLNYPNPFSTSTRFVFTLTGTKVPDYFKIQILTISGKLVKELNKYDLGPLHIGRNITNYAWDGKDEFGDRLAIGLYLYRVVTQLDGKPLDHYNTNADPYFTHGYGKMYLIR